MYVLELNTRAGIDCTDWNNEQARIKSRGLTLNVRAGIKFMIVIKCTGWKLNQGTGIKCTGQN